MHRFCTQKVQGKKTKENASSPDIMVYNNNNLINNSNLHYNKRTGEGLPAGSSSHPCVCVSGASATEKFIFFICLKIKFPGPCVVILVAL